MEQTTDAVTGTRDGIAESEQASGSGLLMLHAAFAYSLWARDRLLGVIAGLDVAVLRQMQERGVYGSIFDTLAHMAASEWLWIQRCMGESPKHSPNGSVFQDLGSLIGWWNGVHVDAVAFLNSITEADLDAELTYTGPDGVKRTRKIWHMLLQVPNHQTEHRSQVATMLGRLGAEVPQTDMVVYFSELAQAK